MANKKNQRTKAAVAQANLSGDIIALFDFFKRYPNKWQTMARDSRTQKALYVLVEMGLIQTNGFDQAIYNTNGG